MRTKKKTSKSCLMIWLIEGMFSFFKEKKKQMKNNVYNNNNNNKYFLKMTYFVGFFLDYLLKSFMSFF